MPNGIMLPITLIVGDRYACKVSNFPAKGNFAILYFFTAGDGATRLFEGSTGRARKVVSETLSR